MDKHFGWWVDLAKVTLGDVTWVHALPFGKYQHPLHGELNFDGSKLNALASSVKQKTRGIDPDIDYDHKTDPAKGNQAAGWVKDAEVRNDGLYLQVDFTTDGAQDIRDKKYRYFSADYADEWQDTQGVVHKDVLMGGGLTNRPYMKNLLPVNLSELSFNTPEEEVDEVDGKKLRVALGLAGNVADDEVFKKLGELGTAVTKLTEEKTLLADEIKKLKAPDETDPELKKLIEASPAFAKLMEDMATKDKQLGELQAGIRLAEVERRMAELQSGKTFAIAPVAKEELKKLMLRLPTDATRELFEFMQRVVTGTGLVDLSEQGYSGRRTGAESDATMRFNDAVKGLMDVDKNMDYGSAVEHVARTQPRLFEEYREATYQFKA